MALSIIALVLSVVALAWQAWTWLRSGPVIKVTVSQTLPLYPNHAGDWHTSVAAVNSGRAATTITSFGFETADGRTLYTSSPAAWSDRLPHRLEPHSSASRHAPTDELTQTCADNSTQYQQLRAWVAGGSGKKVYARTRGIKLQ